MGEAVVTKLLGVLRGHHQHTSAGGPTTPSAIIATQHGHWFQEGAGSGGEEPAGTTVVMGP